MGSDLLTDAQRERLRPTVDAGALERLLAALPPESRPVVMVACIGTPTRADMLALGFDVPDLSGAPELTLTDRDGRQFVPEPSFDCMIDFDDPALAALWAEVEHRPSA